MSTLLNKILIAVFMILLAINTNSYAGGCDKVVMGVIGHYKATILADIVLDYLNSSEAKVALLGRSGSNSPEERFHKKIGFWDYTHGALFYKNDDDKWMAVHLINTCKQESAILNENLKQFFLDDPYEYRTIVAIPTKQMQKALIELIIRKNFANAYRNNSVYSSISYPFSLGRQNSNEYVVDTLAAALALQENKILTNRKQAKEYFINSSYRQKLKTETIKVGFFESLAINAGFGPDNATLSDHPQSEKDSREYSFVSVGSLIDFLQNINMLSAVKEFALEDITKATDSTIIKADDN